jgi:glycosyltransferase involved in cell wall biosynthesis
MTNDQTIDVTAVVPLMEDCPDLGEIIRQYGAEFEERGASYEFVCVLDGLGDERTARIRALVPEGAPVRFVHFNQPFGEERALAVGYKTARGRLVVSLPSYMQLDPGDIHKVIDALEGNFDLVAGHRVPRVDPVMNRVQSWLYNRAMSTLTGVRLHDLNCGLTGLRRRVVDEVLVEGNVSRFLPVLAHRHGFRVGEVKVRHLRERGRQGFFGLGVYVRRVLDVVALLFITRFTRKPLRFFGMAGGLFAVFGLLICAWLGLDYVFGWSTAGDARNRASLVIGMASIVLGVQIFALGLVGEIIIFTGSHNARDYTIERRAGPGRSLAGDVEREPTASVHHMDVASVTEPTAAQPQGSGGAPVTPTEPVEGGGSR